MEKGGLPIKGTMQRGGRGARPPTGWRRRIGYRAKIPSSPRRNCLRTVSCLVGIQLFAIIGSTRDLPFSYGDGALLAGVMLKSAMLILLMLSVVFAFKTMRRSTSWKERWAYIAAWIATLSIIPICAAVMGIP